MFDMKGKKILLLSARVIPEMFQEFQEKSGISKDAVDYIIPSPSKSRLTTCHGQIGRRQRQVTLNVVSDYGKIWFRVAVPFRPSLCTGSWLCEGKGDTIFLMGTSQQG